MACFMLVSCSQGTEPTPSTVEALLEAGADEDALTQARQLVIESPRDASLRILMGRARLAQGDGAAAQAAFEKARELGASESSFKRLLIESLILQGKHEHVLEVLPALLPRSEMDASLIDYRIHALLRIPLAKPREIFLDAKQRLINDGSEAAVILEAMATEDGVVAANARELRRAIAVPAAVVGSRKDIRDAL